MPITLTDWHKLTIGPGASIREALLIIESGRVGIALAVDENQHLLGILTDGDVRRALLTGVDLDSRCGAIVNHDFVRALTGSTERQVLQLIREHSVRQIPVTNADNQIQALYIQSEGSIRHISSAVVIMAGGLGSRLAPLTNNTPKPMLTVSGKPILERLVEQLVSNGFQNIYISVLHLAEQIQDHFGDGSDFGCHISYLETTPLGTAGCLAMLPGETKEAVLVINGDLLTNANFGTILASHSSDNYSATQCIYRHEYKVPFGVVQEEAGEVTGITEKPVESWWVNAGIYVLSPELINSLGEAREMSMIELLQEGKKKFGPIAAVRLMDRWMDIGSVEAWNSANSSTIDDSGR